MVIRVTKVKVLRGGRQKKSTPLQERFVARMIKDVLNSNWAKNSFRAEFRQELGGAEVWVLERGTTRGVFVR